MEPEEEAIHEKRERRIFVAGLTLHVLSGTLATIATFLDFAWQSPANPHFGDPAESLPTISVPLTAFMLFYLGSNFPAMLAWSTSAGWTFNTGFVWLLAAAGVYDAIRKKKVRIIASSIQSLFGVIALGLAVAVGVRAGFHALYGAQSNWVGSIGMLVMSVMLTVSATMLAWLSPTHQTQTALSVGWYAAKDNVQDDNNDVAAAQRDSDADKPIFKKVKTKTCGQLGCCGICNLICSIILFILWLALIGLAVDFSHREPSTSTFAILPDSQVTLSFDSTLNGQTFAMGSYSISFQTDGSGISVTRSSTVVFRSISTEPFIRVGYGTFTASNSEEMGSYRITDNNRQLSTKQYIDQSVQTDGLSYVSLQGHVGGFQNDFNATYSLNFSLVPGTNHLAFTLVVDETSLRVAFGNASTDSVRTYWIHDSSADEKFFGFGESYSYLALKGVCVPIITREQGIGRGMQPFSYFVNRVSFDSAGSWQTTYSAVPYYMTNKMRSFFITDSQFAVFDLTRPDRMSLELVASTMHGRFIAENNLLDIITQYTLYSGRMRALPDWIGSGAVIGLQGGTATVMSQVNALLANGVPLAGVWLQDWTGKRVTSIGSRLLWNWQVDTNFYPGWYDMIATLRLQNISMLTYINAYLADYAPDPITGARTAQPMFAQAKGLGCLITNPDGSPLIQYSGTTDFTFGTVDVTNPTCRGWYAGVIQSNMMNVTAASNGQAYGAMGWMADFAESIPFTAQLYAGPGNIIHNQFPMFWAMTCQQAINTSNGGVDFSTQVTYFTRSSFSTTPQYTTAMWLGDQMQAYNRFDGLATVIPGAVSSGMSGFQYTHSDIGGYLGFSQLGGVVQLVRTQELLWRWMELSAFMDPIFRSHEGIIPDAAPQITSNNATMQQFARFAKIFAALLPYRKSLMADATNLGYPIARHPLLHYQTDRNLDTIQTQVMLGSELMLCAVVHPDVSSTDCYLPAGSGTWTNFFTPSFNVTAGPNGSWFSCPAPLGRPCVMYTAGAVYVPAALQTLASNGFVF